MKDKSKYRLKFLVVQMNWSKKNKLSYKRKTTKLGEIKVVRHWLSLTFLRIYIYYNPYILKQKIKSLNLPKITKK